MVFVVKILATVDAYLE